MIKVLNDGIEVSKNLLDTLPKNNIKNRQKYKLALDDTKAAYSEFLTKIENEIEERYKRYISIDEESEDESSKIKFIKENLFYFNNYNSSYEKYNFDKILYQLNHFYKSDLVELNQNILECIKIFERVGIKLKAEDFNYSEFAYQYMKVLIENPNDTELIKDTFEKIYWQCSDLLIHIELNIRYLYYSNKKAFEKYSNIEREHFSKLFTNDPLSYYYELLINYEKSNSGSLILGLNKFLNKELNINDFQASKIEKCYSFFTNEMPSEDIYEEISKLFNSALEYKNYLSFKYIIDDLKVKYKERNSQKSDTKRINKEIQKREKLIHKYNKKKNKKDKINTKIMILIQELESLYEQLDEAIFYDRLYKTIDDDSSIYDVLALACSHYSYIVKCMKENNKIESFEVEQKKLIEFLLNPYNNIIMNIAISDDKDLALVISDKYKLSNFNITKDNLSTEEGLNEIIENATKINIYNKIVTKLSYDNLKFVCEIKEMFKK